MQRQGTRQAIVVGVLSVAVVIGSTACGGDESPTAGPKDREASRNATPVPAPSGANDAVMTAAVPAPQRPASSPLEAVTAYLDAEVAGRFEDSFALLSAADRADIGTAENWREQHSVSPRVTFYAVVSKPGAPIVTEAAFEPRVDETVGVIAGAAAISWETVEEGGGFVVDRIDTRIDAHFPDESTAGAGVTAWLRRIRHDDPPVGYLGTLLGQPELADELAEEPGAFTPGDVIELDRWSTPEVVTNAFGPDAAVWARVVHVDGPIPFDAVVAPFGEEWVVVGVVALSP